MYKDMEEYFQEQVRKANENDREEFERLFMLLKDEEFFYRIFLKVLEEKSQKLEEEESEESESEEEYDFERIGCEHCNYRGRTYLGEGEYGDKCFFCNEEE